MALFDNMKNAPAPAPEMGEEAQKTLQAFGEAAENPEVIMACDSIVRSTNELCELLGLESSEINSALVAGLALQRQQVIQAKIDAMKPDATEN